jgi:2-amino-4-hydroxy-6-hydroxymethyldihydropteridine diphosphokinase
VRASRLVRSASVGSTGAYRNGAFELATDLPPRTLYEALRELEARHGRVTKGNWAPRGVDLDLVLHETAVVAADDLAVPHVRMHFRRFVLAPLAELSPSARHPLLDLTVAELLGRLDGPGIQVAGAGLALTHAGQIIGWAGVGPGVVGVVGRPGAETSDPAGRCWLPAADCRAHPDREWQRLRQSREPLLTE